MSLGYNDFCWGELLKLHILTVETENGLRVVELDDHFFIVPLLYFILVMQYFVLIEINFKYFFTILREPPSPPRVQKQDPSNVSKLSLLNLHVLLRKR